MDWWADEQTSGIDDKTDEEEIFEVVVSGKFCDDNDYLTPK